MNEKVLNGINETYGGNRLSSKQLNLHIIRRLHNVGLVPRSDGALGPFCCGPRVTNNGVLLTKTTAHGKGSGILVD